MPFSNLDIKRIYYYVICAMAFFVLMWGAIDFLSASIGLLNVRSVESATLSVSADTANLMQDKGDQMFDAYYQKKMLSDRLWDSLARLIIACAIFAYCRFTVNKLEQQA